MSNIPQIYQKQSAITPKNNMSNDWKTQFCEESNFNRNYTMFDYDGDEKKTNSFYKIMKNFTISKEKND